jgi:hypothetical protein
MPEQSRPSVLRIVLTDYYAFLGLMLPCAFGLFFVLLPGLGILPDPGSARLPLAEADLPAGWLVAGAVALVFLAILLWRVWSIHQVFAWGLEVSGQVTHVGFFRDRGRVEYAYTYLGELYHAGNAVMKTARTRSLAIGEAVVVMMDRNRPGRAYIRDLYLR